MADLIVGVIVLAIIGAAASFIIKEKKKQVFLKNSLKILAKKEKCGII